MTQQAYQQRYLYAMSGVTNFISRFLLSNNLLHPIWRLQIGFLHLCTSVCAYDLQEPVGDTVKRQTACCDLEPAVTITALLVTSQTYPNNRLTDYKSNVT